MKLKSLLIVLAILFAMGVSSAICLNHVENTLLIKIIQFTGLTGLLGSLFLVVFLFGHLVDFVWNKKEKTNKDLEPKKIILSSKMFILALVIVLVGLVDLGFIGIARDEFSSYYNRLFYSAGAFFCTILFLVLIYYWAFCIKSTKSTKE